MRYYVGLDASLRQTSICIVDEARTVVRRAKSPPMPKRSRCGCRSRICNLNWSGSSLLG